MRPFCIIRAQRIWWVLCGATVRWTTNMTDAFRIAEALQG
jgi:hypothetical protein